MHPAPSRLALHSRSRARRSVRPLAEPAVASDPLVALRTEGDLMPKQGTETVVVRRASTRNRNGDRVLGEVVGELTRCIIWPRSSTETANRGIVAIDGHNVWAPSPVTLDVRATDEVEVRGETYQIEGKPGDWRKPNGIEQGLLFQTKQYGT